MTGWVAPALAGTASFVLMEGVAWAAHRYVMHGWLWSWHKSHHEPHDGVLERNDRFALVGMAGAIFIFWLRYHVGWIAFGVGMGVSVYGLFYALLHDGLVHRRLPMGRQPKGGYLGRLVTAHHLHHAVQGKGGCVSFGFLYAPPVSALRRKLASNRSAA